MYKRFFSRASSVLLACNLVLLTACGGGGSSTAQTATPTDTTTAGNDTTPTVKPVEVAGRAYLDAAGTDMIFINANGLGVKHIKNARLPSVPVTWNISGNDLTLASPYDQETLKASADGSTLTGKQTTYTRAKSLSLAALNGKHLTETFKPGSYCTARTFAFTNTLLTIREQCGYTFTEFSLTLSEETAWKDLILAYGTVNGEYISTYIALREGSTDNKGTMLFSIGEGAEESSFIATASPLQQQTETQPLPNLPSTPCNLLTAYKFTCPSENYLQDELLTSCVFKPSLWLVNKASLSCGIKQITGSTTTGYIFYPDPNDTITLTNIYLE